MAAHVTGFAGPRPHIGCQAVAGEPNRARWAPARPPARGLCRLPRRCQSFAAGCGTTPWHAGSWGLTAGRRWLRS